MSLYKDLQKDSVFLFNILYKGQIEIDQVYDSIFLEDTKIEGSFETSIVCMNILVNFLA